MTEFFNALTAANAARLALFYVLYLIVQRWLWTIYTIAENSLIITFARLMQGGSDNGKIDRDKTNYDS